MRYSISLLIQLAGLWLLLSGHYNALLLSLGALSCLLVLWLARRMLVVDDETQPLHLALRLPGYWMWLALEIVKSNIDVTRRLLSPSLPISPTLKRVAAHEKTELGQAIYANSITLTPGTVSVSLREGAIDVHALTREGAANLEDGDMHRRVMAMEGRGPREQD